MSQLNGDVFIFINSTFDSMSKELENMDSGQLVEVAKELESPPCPLR